MLLYIKYLQILLKISIYILFLSGFHNTFSFSKYSNNLFNFVSKNNSFINSTIENLIEENASPSQWYTFEEDQKFSSQQAILNNFKFKDKKIALLITGLFSNQYTLTSLARFLKEQKIYDHIFCLSYGTTNKNLLQEATQSLTNGLVNIICQKQNTEEPAQIDIFAHSYGGIIVRNSLENLSSKEAQVILNQCKHIFFFGTPHKGIKPTIFKNITDILYNKAIQEPNIAGMAQIIGLTSTIALNIVEKLDPYHHLTGRTPVLNNLKSTLYPHYYNIIGTNHIISFPNINLRNIKFSTGNFIHEGYQKTDPKSITDGVVSKESASLTPQGLDPSHELEVPYNHNELIGIGNKENPHKIPISIGEWIKSILSKSSPITSITEK